MYKKTYKKIVIYVISVLFILSLAFTFASCSRQAVFGNLTIAESIASETKEPVNVKNEFDSNVEEIFAAIKIENIKGDDNYRFVWKDLEDDSILKEIDGKYKEGEKQFLSGWISGSLTIKEGNTVLLPAGKYKVEFYHNGALKSSAEFTVKNPEAKILQVALSKEINENAEPGDPSESFVPTDTVYACVQLDFLVPGDTVQSKWLDEQGNTVLETPLNITDEFYQPSWIYFSFKGADEKPIPEGKYNVEIYLNQQLFGKFPFEIIAEKQESGSVTFDENNYFTEAKDKYNFVISYPDNWKFSWKEDNTGMTVNFNPPNPDEAVSTLMIVLTKGNYPTGSQEIDNFVAEIVAGTRGSMNQIGEPVFTEKKMKDDTTYGEAIYYFNDPSKGNFGLILSIFIKNEKMFIWYGFAHETYYDALNIAYYTAFNSLEFN